MMVEETKRGKEILIILYNTDKPLYIREMEQRSKCPSLRPVVHQLKKDNYVERTNKENKQKKYFQLTNKGQERAEELTQNDGNK